MRAQNDALPTARVYPASLPGLACEEVTAIVLSLVLPNEHPVFGYIRKEGNRMKGIQQQFQQSTRYRV
jgi:hypothetical protein